MDSRVIDSFLIGALLAGGAVYVATGTQALPEPPILAGVPDVRQAEYCIGVFIRGEAPAERPAFVTWGVLPTYVPPAPLP